jgi:hypothetical protein
MTPTESLRAGCEILDPVLMADGFVRRKIQFGQGSGGSFARTEYQRGDRRLELHFRYSLGLVTYHVAALSLSHEAYMRAVLGRRGANQYPGFSEDPLDGFRHLRHDLERYCVDFLIRTHEAMQRIAAKAAEQTKVSGFKAFSDSQRV